MEAPPRCGSAAPPQGGAADARAEPGRGGCLACTLRVAKSSFVAAWLAVGFAAPAAAAWYAPWNWFDSSEPALTNTVRDPHYGDVLFQFYQGRYFTSITTLMTSQHFERVPQHADEAEVLRGGLLLSYGLHREAGQIFAQLIERGAAPPVRDRAWYYLAKIRYQRGFLADAETALARIEGPLPGALEEDRGLLQANLLLARADYAAAAEVLNGMTASGTAGPYARYNLGVALIRSGDSAGGSRWLTELGQAPAAGEEARSLRDRANVALGFAALQDERAEDARGHLERVRLTSLHANKALLGFGWAAAALKQPEQALVPWTELAGRDASDAAVLEARIAVPYAYAELGAHGQALTRYEEAIAAFEAEGGRLDESIAAIRGGRLVDGLIERNPGEEMGWFWSIRELPEMPHASHLTQVLAQHEFQEAFKNYRDLQFLERNLRDWQERLGVFGDMLTTRRQAYATRLPEVRAQAGQTGLAGLQQRSEVLAKELVEAEATADGAAFADARQRALRERLQSVRAAIDAAPAGDPELAQAVERYRRVAGALAWELAREHPVRVWEAKKGLVAIERGLTEARGREAALAQAQRDEPARFDAFDVRIRALGPRIDALLPRTVALAREQQAVVQDLAVAELTRQKERLATYTVQARFAVAQLYDRATVSGSGNDASRR